MNEAEQGFKSLGTKSKRISFPLLFWEEFEADCKENFNDTYYLKIMADHEYRKSMQSITRLVVQDLAMLQAEVAELRLELETIKEEILAESKETTQEDKKSSNTGSESPRKGYTTFGE